MKKVITYGTFDLLHWGHINLLKRAKGLGDYLIVAVSSDEFNKIKKKKSYHSYENRKMMLEAIRYVDEVIPECDWEQKVKDIQEHDVDVFVMGDDWKGEFDFLKSYCEIVYLPRTIGISSSKIKQELMLIAR
ncbi:glycerol-3-phosphate cytidylyltransferase [Bacillus wiedmannii]|uniref:glycerol-3-phosphate cytidylyltransferase n=1 Tax=Bacillus wiedmannii TaxID=1890302 RepID=UPI000D094E42|nr:glycerol-3-phosphate cytidylyltransferase [Bacillus wiedmannii]MCU5681701.1 glycerol-3-phosphate cytidylyltransferase [Bacillus wiedmannii]PRT21719.1 glycerol-3-phosphate cytidylyltransferase [Bacillus wiedmannii]